MTSSAACWICHQECAIKDNVHQKNQSPCLCKGSLESVHRECLNMWVTKRYKKIIKEINLDNIPVDSIDETNPMLQKLNVHCPNCRYSLQFEVIELPPNYFNFSAIFNYHRKEKIILLILIGIQLFLFSLDYFKNDQNQDDIKYQNENSIQNQSPKSFLQMIESSNNQKQYQIIDILNISLILIILFAAGYNIIFDRGIDWGIEVKDRDYLQIQTLNIAKNIKK